MAAIKFNYSIIYLFKDLNFEIVLKIEIPKSITGILYSLEQFSSLIFPYVVLQSFTSNDNSSQFEQFNPFLGMHLKFCELEKSSNELEVSEHSSDQKMK